MAEPYLMELEELIRSLGAHRISGAALTTKHFFSGAALYANGKICASLSPAGLAIKLPEDQKNRLIASGQAAAFRFFPSGPVKHEYARLSERLVQDSQALEDILSISIGYVLGPAATNQ